MNLGLAKPYCLAIWRLPYKDLQRTEPTLYRPCQDVAINPSLQNEPPLGKAVSKTLWK